MVDQQVSFCTYCSDKYCFSTYYMLNLSLYLHARSYTQVCQLGTWHPLEKGKYDKEGYFSRGSPTQENNPCQNIDRKTDQNTKFHRIHLVSGRNEDGMGGLFLRLYRIL